MKLKFWEKDVAVEKSQREKNLNQVLVYTGDSKLREALLYVSDCSDDDFANDKKNLFKKVYRKPIATINNIEELVNNRDKEILQLKNIYKSAASRSTSYGEYENYRDFFDERGDIQYLPESVVSSEFIDTIVSEINKKYDPLLAPLVDKRNIEIKCVKNFASELSNAMTKSRDLVLNNKTPSIDFDSDFKWVKKNLFEAYNLIHGDYSTLKEYEKEV
ncbi:MAG: hypothetical protein ACP5NV_00670 [Candidatus Woesearchaeota archaeon]